MSLSAYALLTSEIIQYTMDNASSTTDLDDRLDRIGYEVGGRNLELLSYRDRAPRRKTEILDALRFIHSTAWPFMFGKPADDLQQAAAVGALAKHEFKPSSPFRLRAGSSVPTHNPAPFCPG